MVACPKKTETISGTRLNLGRFSAGVFANGCVTDPSCGRNTNMRTYNYKNATRRPEAAYGNHKNRPVNHYRNGEVDYIPILAMVVWDVWCGERCLALFKGGYLHKTSTKRTNQDAPQEVIIPISHKTRNCKKHGARQQCCWQSIGEQKKCRQGYPSPENR